MSTQLQPISNRLESQPGFQLPEHGWYQLAPVGEYLHAETGLIQVLDNAALDSIVNRFKQESAQPNFPGLLIDYEHFSYDPKERSTASGWIKELENRSGGLWMRVQWTGPAEAAIRNGEYRFTSPVWLQRDVEKLGGNRIRPLRLDSAGLTNNPNLKGMVPLSNRAAGAVAETDATRPPQPQPKSNMIDYKKALLAILGLAADASDEQIQAKLDGEKGAMSNRAQQLAEANTQIQQLTEANTRLLGELAEADLDKFANRFAPEQRETWKASLLTNRATTLKLLSSIAAPPAPAPNPPPNPIHNRASATPPKGPALTEKPAGEKAGAARRAADEYALTNRCSFDRAWAWVRSNKPELFAETAGQ